MPLLTDEKYTFVSSALPEDTFAVVEFSGTEGLSRPYEFEILLTSEEKDIDLTEVLNKPAVFTIRRPDGDVPFHGLLARFEQQQEYGEYVFYHAVLMPKFWWLSLTFHNQVFLNKSLPDILKEVLKDGGLTNDDFELKLQKNYPVWEYVCQYRESHFHFVSRWMERDGLYYYFEQNDDREKLIITDSAMAHTDMPQGGTITFSPPSGLNALHREEVISAFAWRQQMLPKEVVLKDYNYLAPSLDLTVQARVKANGRGQVYIYGEHYRTKEEGQALAQIRAEELLCREKRFSGESQVPFIRPGYKFILQEHFLESLNQDYLTLTVEHQGSQAAYLTAGLKEAVAGREDRLFYKNRFAAVEASRQYRPPRQTEKERFYGAINAVIDAAGSGQNAELDDMGRYKVILPFDMSGRKDGKASAYLRLMQPYGGSNHGMHFPLHKGTEVLLAFIDGDPDRPVIIGTVPNPDHPSLVTEANQTQCRITTAGGNKIHIEDQAGSRRILMHSPFADSFIRLGAPNDPQPQWGEKAVWKKDVPEKDGIVLATTQGFDCKANVANTIVLGENSAVTGGLDAKSVFAGRFDMTLGNRLNLALFTQTDIKWGWHWKGGPGFTEMEGMQERVIVERIDSIAATQAVQAKITKMTGQVNKAIGQANRIEGKLTRAVGQANTAHGNLTRVTGVAQRAHGSLTRAVGRAERVQGQVTRAVGTANRAGARLTRAVGDANTVAGELTRAATSLNSQAAAVFRASGIDSTL
jgi:type VI secretion system secreted protein VgrG